MIGKDNWTMVKCATEGCTSPEWLMHWPCEGSEEEIRHGKHFCRECLSKQWQAECEADPVRSYPVKRVGSVQVRAQNGRTLTKAAIVVETETEIKDKEREFKNGEAI